MNDEADKELEKNDGVLCPECGEGVRTMLDINRRWTHRSRVIPRVLWVILCLGLIGYWVSVGSYSASQTPAAEMPIQADENSWWSQDSLHPSLSKFGVDEDYTYVSSLDIQGAIDGDDDALMRVVEKINEASEFNREPADSWGTVERVQFVWHEPYGSMGSIRIYRFGRFMLLSNEDIMLQDIRDESSVGHDSYHWSWGEGGWSFWPLFGHQRVTHYDDQFQNGAVSHSWRVDLVGVFQIVSVCLAMAWLFGLVIRLFRVPKTKRRKVCYGVFFVLLVSACIVIVIEAHVREYKRGEDNQGVALSGAFTVGYLDRVVADENSLIEFLQDLLDLLPEGQEELLLAQAWEYVSEGDQGIVPSHKMVTFTLGQFWAWIHFDQYVYEHIDETQKIEQQPRWSWWPQLVHLGAIELRWGPLERQSTLSLSIFGWISIGVMFWIIWSTLHGTARFVFRRIQKRRVLRNQCVFCAYPLTQEATQARYPQVES